MRGEVSGRFVGNEGYERTDGAARNHDARRESAVLEEPLCWERDLHSQ